MSKPIFAKWKLVKSDKFDEYMKAVGVNIALRKMGALVSSTTEISQEDDKHIRINTQSTFKSANVLFDLNGAIEEKTMDGRTCQTTIVFDGDDKLHQVQFWDNGKRTAVLDWIYKDGKMVLRLECDGVVCERLHEKCE